MAGASQLLAAQEAAKAARKGIWANYVEPEDIEEDLEQVSGAMNGATAAVKPVTVTHVSHGQCMHIQVRHHINSTCR